MGLRRIASVAAVCLVLAGVGGMVGSVALDGSAVPATAAMPTTTTRGSTTEAPQVVESWASADDWASAGVGVFQGRLHGSGGPVTGAFRALRNDLGPDLFLRGSIALVSGRSGGMTALGVSVASTRAVSSEAGLISIGFDAAGRPASYQGPDAGGAGESILDTAPQPQGRYWVTVTAGADGIGLVMTNADGSREWRWAVRAEDLERPVTDVAVWNADRRGMAGSTVRTVGYRQSDLPLTPVEGLVSDAPIVVLGWGADGETTERIALPGDYDPAVAVPLVLFAHGSSTDESSVLGTSMVKVYTALLQAGYAVASSSQHGNNWGNDASVQDLESLYRDVADRVDVENRAFLLAESMGGLSSLRLAAEGDVPVAAWAGIYPVTDLGAAWQDGERRADIRSAFGIRPDGSDYALRTAGADPALIDPSAFDGLAMRFYASWQDTVVPAQEHSQAFLRRVVGHVSEGALVTHVGNHGDPSAFRPTDIVAFFDRNR